MKLTRLLPVAILTALCTFSSSIHGQDAAPKPTQEDVEIAAKKATEAALGTRKKNLLALSEDLESMAKSLRGVDVDNTLAIDQRAAYGVMYLDATIWFVATYHRMECDTDRAVAKTVLQNRLAFYAHMLDMAVDQTNGYLALSRVPAVAQQGQRVRDELRAAKNQLDEIATSLK